jgi:hypothetical protein
VICCLRSPPYFAVLDPSLLCCLLVFFTFLRSFSQRTRCFILSLTPTTYQNAEMKFFAIFSLGLAVAASAQVSTGTVSSNAIVSITSHSTSTSASLSPEQTCLAACARTDICCQAACVKVPCKLHKNQQIMGRTHNKNSRPKPSQRKCHN